MILFTTPTYFNWYFDEDLPKLDENVFIEGCCYVFILQENKVLNALFSSEGKRGFFLDEWNDNNYSQFFPEAHRTMIDYFWIDK